MLEVMFWVLMWYLVGMVSIYLIEWLDVVFRKVESCTVGELLSKSLLGVVALAALIVFVICIVITKIPKIPDSLTKRKLFK